MDPYAEADLRRQQAAFGRETRTIDKQNSWFAAAALAPVATVIGLEAAGVLPAKLLNQVDWGNPLNFPRRGPPFKFRGDNIFAQIGRRADADFGARVDAKPGWRSQLTIRNENGTFRPDLSAPARNPEDLDSRFQLELKPDTPSGRRAAARAVKKYFKGTGNKTRAIFYNPEDYE